MGWLLASGSQSIWRRQWHPTPVLLPGKSHGQRSLVGCSPWMLRGSQAPRRAVCGTRGSLRTMHGGGSTPSCCAFTHRVAFDEGSGPRVLLKGGPGNRGRSACGPTHVARLEFPRETGLILRCAGKAGNPFQTTQGNRLSCRNPEGRALQMTWAASQHGYQEGQQALV